MPQKIVRLRNLRNLSDQFAGYNAHDLPLDAGYDPGPGPDASGTRGTAGLGMPFFPQEEFVGPPLPEHLESGPQAPPGLGLGDALAESQRQQVSSPDSLGAPPAASTLAPADSAGPPISSTPPKEAAGGFDPERRARVLRSVAQASDTLGNLDFTPHARLGVFGIRVPGRKPYQDTAAHQEAALATDELSEGERQMLQEAFGINVPEGARFSRIERIVPEIAHSLRYRQGYMTPWQAHQVQMSENRDRRAEDTAERMARTAELAEAREGRQERVSRRLPAEDRRTLVQITQAKKTINRVLKDASSASFGPIAGRAQELFRKIGLADPETIGTAARLADAINDYIYATTGKQLNREELSRLSAQLPQTWDSPEAFQSIGKVFQEQLELAYDETLQGLERDGFDTSRWRSDSEATTKAEDETKGLTPMTLTPPTPSPEGGGMIKVRGPNGEVGLIHSSQWEAFLQKYPGSTQEK